MDHGLQVDAQHKLHEGLQLNLDHEGLQTASLIKGQKSWAGRARTWTGRDRNDQNNHEPRRKVLGLSIGMFWAVVVLLVLIIAIGGGVGAGLASQTKNSSSPSKSVTETPLPNASATSSSFSSSSSSSSSSSTASSTTSAPTSGPSPIIKTPCTTDLSNNGTLYTAIDSHGFPLAKFQLLCNTNFPAGTTYGNPNTQDLMMLYTTDMNGCMVACAAWNAGAGNPKCAAVAIVKDVGQYCYLKSGTGKNNTSTSGGAPIDSAVLMP